MSTGRRLALFAVALVAVFAVAYGVAAVAVPDSVVHSWNQRAHDSHGARPVTGPVTIARRLRYTPPCRTLSSIRRERVSR